MKTKLNIEVLEPRQLLSGCNGIDSSAGMNDSGTLGSGPDVMGNIALFTQVCELCQVVVPAPYNTACVPIVAGAVLLAAGISNPPSGPMSLTDNGCGL